MKQFRLNIQSVLKEQRKKLLKQNLEISYLKVKPTYMKEKSEVEVRVLFIFINQELQISL